jgi:prostaglandin-endoperoxide synthase 2
MVAVDAFSQALTNPLLSEHVFNEGTFTPIGWKTIQDTGSLRDIVARNSKQDIGTARISMTRPGWKYH